MAIDPVPTETTYALTAAALGPFATVWPYAETDDVQAWLDLGQGRVRLSTPADYAQADGAHPLAAGGTVTLSASLLVDGAWPAGSALTLARGTPRGQPSSFGDVDGFSPQAMQAAIENIERQVQELSSIEARTLQLPPGEATPIWPRSGQRIGKYLSGDGRGDLVFGPPPDLTIAVATADFASVTAAAAVHLAAPLPAFLRTAGFNAAGDGGGALYRKVSSQPSHPGRFQTADGAWWELAEAVVNVKALGAKGDNVTDDSAAIVDAMHVAAAHANGTQYVNGNLEVYFPAGRYHVASGVLSNNVLAPRDGLVFSGAGASNSILYLVSNGSDQGWFYDNAGAVSQRNVFRQLRFTGQTADFCNGFRLNDTAGEEKRFQFHSCTFDTLADVLSTTGTTNADECTFVACEFTNVRTAVRLNNPQSMLHHFVACRGAFLRDIIIDESGGGGEVLWLGGSIILAPDDGEDHFWVLGSGDPTVSVQTGQFQFAKFRAELRGPNAKLINWLNGSSTAAGRKVRFDFDGVNIATANQGSGVTRPDVVNIGANKTVSFRDCVLPVTHVGTTDDYGYTITSDDTVTALASPGLIEWERCTVQAELADKVTITNAYGVARAHACVGNGALTDVQRRAIDFDINWIASLGAAISAPVKIVSLKRALWPNSDGNEWAVQLPPGAVVVRALLYKPAFGTSSTMVQYYIGSDDKSVIYGSSTSARQDAEHKFDVSVNLAALGAADKVRLWSDPDGPLQQSTGYALVEYV